LTLKRIRSEIKAAASTWAWDLGYHQDWTRWAYGISYENIGGELQYQNQSDPVPRNLRLALSWRATPKWTWTSDFVTPKDEDDWVGVGTEYRFHLGQDVLWALRAGYSSRYKKSLDGSSSFTAGSTFGVGRYHLHYAFTPMGELGDGHRISMEASFRNPFNMFDSSGPQKGPVISQKGLEAQKDALSYPKRPWRKKPGKSWEAEKSIRKLMAQHKLCSEFGPKALLVWRKGPVRVYNDGVSRRSFFKKAPTYLFERDMIKTKRGEAHLVFLNGTRVKVGRHSTLEFKDTADACRTAITVARPGELWLKVDKGKTFEIETDLGKIHLSESEVHLFMTPRIIQVEVYQGKAHFIDDGMPIEVSKGVVLVKTDGEEPPQIKSLDKEFSYDFENILFPQGQKIPGRWDPHFSENFEAAIKRLDELPHIDVAEYIRDQKLRDAHEIIIEDIEMAQAELRLQQVQFKEDVQSFKSMRKEIKTEIKKPKYDKDKVRELKIEKKEVNRGLKSAKRAKRRIHGDINRLTRELRRHQTKLAKLAMLRTIQISAEVPNFEVTPKGEDTHDLDRSWPSLDPVADAIQNLWPQKIVIPIGGQWTKEQLEEVIQYLSVRTQVPEKSFELKKEPPQPDDDSFSFRAPIRIWLVLRGL
jgi:hypothetical protein